MIKCYFASNMPGGKGGMDLYKCYWRNGRWSQPLNLGTGINTKGDELFPYVSEEGILYFSSNGRTERSKKNMDVFAAEIILNGCGAPYPLLLRYEPGKDIGITYAPFIVVDAVAINDNAYPTSGMIDLSDGMDLSVVEIHRSKGVIKIASANRPVIIKTAGVIQEVRGDPRPVGGTTHPDGAFTCHMFYWNQGDQVYLFSDGVTDQFGGPAGKKSNAQSFLI
jgi:hypothetical protein